MIQLGTYIRIADNTVLFSDNVSKFWKHLKID